MNLPDVDDDEAWRKMFSDLVEEGIMSGEAFVAMRPAPWYRRVKWWLQGTPWALTVAELVPIKDLMKRKSNWRVRE